MKNLQKLLKEITELTFKIEKNYPELYRFLEEDPITIPSGNYPHIHNKIMEDYLGSLKQLLEHHIETHKKK